MCVCVCLMKAFKPIHFFFTSFFMKQSVMLQPVKLC